MIPNRKLVILLGVTAGLVMILAVVLAFVLGRQSASPDDPPAPVNKAATVPPPLPEDGNQASAAPAPGGGDDSLARWLAGGWAEASTNCRTDTGDYYDPSGRYGRSGAEGLWRIENGALIVTVTHEAVGDPMAHEFIGLPDPETTRSRITREGQDRMTRIIGGRSVRMMRCPLARHSFAT
jgi:hypothetical protein